MEIWKLTLLIIFVAISASVSGQNPFNQSLSINVYPQATIKSGLSYNSGLKLVQLTQGGGDNYSWEIFNHGLIHAFCIYDRTAQAYRMFIATNGNVGIGTTNVANAKLNVNGKILAEEFEIITDVPASDFVFDKEYKLRSLKEVEKFVQQNKHLPEIPSAKEFKENGYKVGQMDDLLLRKVEELTLYTIELNKQVEALKAELAKVKGGE